VEPVSPPRLTATHERLTARERQVLALRADGRSVAEVAAALGVGQRTVRFHLQHLYAKLGLRQRSQGARQAALSRYAGGAESAAPAGGAGGRALFRPDRKLTEVVGRGRFTVSAEVTPPRNGADQEAVLDQVGRLVGAGAQFLAVTKGAGGSLRGGSLPIAQTIKEHFGVPAIAHFTCRDLLPEEVENQLVDHHYFGIRNLLALRGDPPDGQPEWAPRPGGHRYAYELVAQIQGLNGGRYLRRPGGRTDGGQGQEPTDFDVGVAVYPEHPDPQEGLDFFRRKVEAGARFAITQMVFDPEAYGRLLDRCERSGVDVPVLPGTRILRSRVQARRTAARFGVSVPAALLGQLGSLDDPGATERALDLTCRLVERLRSYGAPGVHLFVTDTTSAALLIARLVAPSVAPSVASQK
jgi:methylenetetrahydrofolate reductase (NADPH)